MKMKLSFLILLSAWVLAMLASAVCNDAQLRGNWSVLGYGTTTWNLADGTQTNESRPVTGVGVVGIRTPGRIGGGWIVVKVGDISFHTTNFTGWYNVTRDTCTLWVTVEIEGQFNASFLGTIEWNRNRVNFIYWPLGEEVIGEMTSMDFGCNANSIRGVWSTAAIRWNPDGTKDSILETLQCTRDSCTVWQEGSALSADINGTSANVTMTPWCMFTFNNESALAGYIAVPFGQGMYVIQSSPAYSLATTFMKTAR